MSGYGIVLFKYVGKWTIALQTDGNLTVHSNYYRRKNIYREDLPFDFDLSAYAGIFPKRVLSAIASFRKGVQE